jgi:hypothetical protein
LAALFMTYCIVRRRPSVSHAVLKIKEAQYMPSFFPFDLQVAIAYMVSR